MDRTLSKRSKNKAAWISGGVAFATAIAGTSLAGGATVTPINAADIPISTPSSVFDASHTGNSYSLETGTTFIPAGFDVRDLFGGSFGTFGPEQSDVIFENYQPIGNVESIDVVLSSPVSLTNFSLFLQEDSNGDRSASEFKLFSNGQLIDDVPILDNSGSESYLGQYGSMDIQVSDLLSGLPVSSEYTLQLIQNHNANYSSGIRAMDFTATGTSTPTLGTASVPEPASVAGLILGGSTILSRRRRI